MSHLNPYYITKYLDDSKSDNPDDHSFSNRRVGEIILAVLHSTTESIGVYEREWKNIANRLMGDYSRTPTPVPDEYSNKLKDLIE